MYAARYVVWRSAIEVVLRVVIHIGEKPVGVKRCCVNTRQVLPRNQIVMLTDRYEHQGAWAQARRA
jgi:hypothetical protein